MGNYFILLPVLDHFFKGILYMSVHMQLFHLKGPLKSLLISQLWDWMNFYLGLLSWESWEEGVCILSGFHW